MICLSGFLLEQKIILSLRFLSEIISYLSLRFLFQNRKMICHPVFLAYFTQMKRVMINCSKFVCSKNLLNTILLLLDSVREIIIFLFNWSTAVLNLLSCRINWIRAISIICVNCSHYRPFSIQTVDTVKRDKNFCLNCNYSTKIYLQEHVRQELVKKIANMYGSQVRCQVR